MRHLEKLTETRNKLIGEIALLNFDQFNWSPGPDKWSIAQVCHHLFLTEVASTNVIAHGLKKTNNNTAIERKQVQRILDRTKKIKAPQIVEPETEPLQIQQIIEMFNHSRSNLISLLEKLEDESVLSEKSVTHPAFGDLPLDQWVEQIYLHEIRHLEQIREIKSLKD